MSYLADESLLRIRTGLRLLPLIGQRSGIILSEEWRSSFLSALRTASTGWAAACIQEPRLVWAVDRAVGASPPPHLESKTETSIILALFCSASEIQISSDAYMLMGDCAAYCDNLIQLSEDYLGGEIGVQEIKRTSMLATQEDHAVLNKKGSLQTAPLWSGAIACPSIILNNWKSISKQLLELDEDWDVWTDWYDARFRGAAINGRYEYARSMLPNEEWQRRHALINQNIKRVLAENLEELSQDTNAQVFSGTSRGQIDLAAPSQSQMLRSTPDQEHLLEQIRLEANALQSLGANMLGDELNKRLIAYTELIQDTGKSISAFQYWPRLNALRATMRKHDVTSAHDLSVSSLKPAVAEELRQILGLANVHALGDPTLQSIDDRSIGPREAADKIAELNAGRAIVTIVVRETMIPTARARVELIARDDDVRSAAADDAGRRAVDNARRTNKNFLAATVSEIAKMARTTENAALSEEVKQSVPIFNEFIKSHAPALQEYIRISFKNVDINHIFERILQFFS